MNGVDILPRFGKPARIENTKLMDEVRNMPCVITGNPPPNDPHHLASKGSRGSDVEWNIVSLKHELHQEFHKIGFVTFAAKYPKFRDWLHDHGWMFDATIGKWRHDFEDSEMFYTQQRILNRLYVAFNPLVFKAAEELNKSELNQKESKDE